MKLLVYLTLVATSYALIPERQPVKRSYVCPPKFIRQGHRCYYFSKDETTWQDAHFKCRDMHSNIAIIKSANQDKLIRNFLGQKSLAPLERWIGGMYDWEQMSWKWFTGKPLSYNGFDNSEANKESPEEKEAMRWHCIIMDPSLGFKWSSRSCVERKHYICHTKLKVVSNKGKKKLQRQYHADKFNKLNEIPVPTIPDYSNDTMPLKSNLPFTYKVEINNSLNDEALFAETPVAKRRKARKNKKKRKTKYRQLDLGRNTNCTIEEVPNSLDNRNRKKYRCKENDAPLLMKNLRWKNYQRRVNRVNPLYPNVIVEEYNFAKES